MKKILCKILAISLSIPQMALSKANDDFRSVAAPILLEGYVPNETLSLEVPGQPRSKKIFFLIDKGVIQKYFSKMPSEDQIPENTIRLTENLTGKLLLSPGFIDMHNHLDHAVVPLWDKAHGQFNNRFSWRGDPDYKNNVRGQVTKIKDLDKENKLSGVESNSCKIIQYAELKALLGGVTTIQGIGGTSNNACAFNQLIRNVENKDDFRVVTDAKVSFEVINPIHGIMLQDHVIPMMKSSRLTMDQAYAQVPKEIKDSEPFSKRFKPTELTSLTDDLFNKLNSFRETFEAMVAVNPNGKIRAFITHLAEGKSEDPFSKTEFKMAQAIGIAQPGMVLIHGIGLNAQDWLAAKKADVSLVWSPFSNLLLYGETTDVAAAKTAGINISLGSDWSPSGSKTLLDEVKIAKRYLKASRQENVFSDKDFYEMMTINAAKALKLEDRLGKLAPGYLADIVAVPLTSLKANPYSTIVNSKSDSIKLVILGGQIAIADKDWVKDSDVTEPILTEFSLSCAKMKDQVFVNLGFSLKETITTLKPLVKVLDGHISCSDKVYQSKIDQLFKNDFRPENRGQINLANDEQTFQVLNSQLTDLLNVPATMK
jgi:hypothetical protein